MNLPRTIREIHDSFDQKKLSPVELTEHYLKKAKESRHNAFLQVLETRAREQAKTAQSILEKEGKVPRGRMPLLGIPIGIKDLLHIDGVKTTCASKILKDYVAPFTATSVARLEAAGSVSLGKLNMDEFAMGSSNENSAFGGVLHPTHEDRVPGGSSGGSATAVGADLCVASLGTDTGGSIRLPAAFCGIVGVKPTYGRVSRNGCVAFASSLDQIGPMTKNVEDAVLVAQTMAGCDPMDSTTSPNAIPDWMAALARAKDEDLRGLRVGVPKEYFVGGLQPEVEEHIQGALKWMEGKGMKLVPVSLPHTKYALATYYIVAVSEASSNLSRFDGIRFSSRPDEAEHATKLDDFYKIVRSDFGPEVKRRILLGTFALSSGYYDAFYSRACKVRRRIRDDFTAAFKNCDLIACPVVPTTAFKKGEKAADPLQMYLMDVFAIPASLAGLPAMSLPCGKDKAGLSVGLQLIGPSFEEERIFRVAHLFEKGAGK